VSEAGQWQDRTGYKGQTKEGRSGINDGSQSPTFVVVPSFLPHTVMLCFLVFFCLIVCYLLYLYCVIELTSLTIHGMRTFVYTCRSVKWWLMLVFPSRRDPFHYNALPFSYHRTPFLPSSYLNIFFLFCHSSSFSSCLFFSFSYYSTTSLVFIIYHYLSSFLPSLLPSLFFHSLPRFS
jgi:hypothetical protein